MKSPDLSFQGIKPSASSHQQTKKHKVETTQNTKAITKAFVLQVKVKIFSYDFFYHSTALSGPIIPWKQIFPDVESAIIAGFPLVIKKTVPSLNSNLLRAPKILEVAGSVPLRFILAVREINTENHEGNTAMHVIGALFKERHVRQFSSIQYLPVFLHTMILQRARHYCFSNLTVR